MEKSVVTFSRQRRKESLVGDLVSSPESVGSNMEKREDTVLVLMATSIVPELIYLYIPMGLVSMKVASSSLYSSSNLSDDCDCCYHSPSCLISPKGGGVGNIITP
jgi:hypothetical protein